MCCCKKLISVIIPIYNTDNRMIQRCVNGIMYQKFQDVEIIIIDDGSDEECALFLDLIAENETGIRVFHTSNNGVSSARNYGVKKSLGEYIIFVDGDDVVDNNFIKIARDNIKKYSDVKIFYYYMCQQKNGVINNFSIDLDVHMLSNEERLLLMKRMVISTNDTFVMKNGGYIGRGCYARVIAKDVLKDIRFSESLSLGEDAIWNLEILMKERISMVVEYVAYYYVRNENSATCRYRSDIYNEEKKLLDKYYELVGDNKAFDVNMFNRTIECLREMLRLYYAHENYPRNLSCANREYKNILKNDQTFKRYFKVYKNIGVISKIKYYIFVRNPLPVFTYKCLRKIKKNL